MKYFVLFCLLNTMMPNAAIAAALDLTKIEGHGLSCERDQFSNVHITIPEGMAEGCFKDRLHQLVEACKEDDRIAACLIKVAHENGRYLPAIKSNGFELLYANNDGTQWIMRGYSDVPAPFTATQGARIILLAKENGAFLIAGIKDRYKSSFMFPGGFVDAGEVPAKACARECGEEIGVSVTPAELQPLAILLRTGANCYNADNACFYYVAEVDKQELKPDGREVESAFWVPLAEVLAQEEYNGLPLSIVTKAVLKQLDQKLQGAAATKKLILPDFIRQRDKEIKNEDDCMELQLFA